MSVGHERQDRSLDFAPISPERGLTWPTPANGSGPNLFEPSVPFVQNQTIIMMAPTMGMKSNSIHQPLRSSIVQPPHRHRKARQEYGEGENVIDRSMTGHVEDRSVDACCDGFADKPE